MRVTDGDGQRVGRVGRPGFAHRQQRLDHHRDLLFFGVADADHRFLDQVRRIFGDLESAQRKRGERDAAGLAEL